MSKGHTLGQGSLWVSRDAQTARYLARYHPEAPGQCYHPSVKSRERQENPGRAKFPLACRSQCWPLLFQSYLGAITVPDEQQAVKSRQSHKHVTWSRDVLPTATELSQLHRCNTEKNVLLSMLLCSALPYIKMFFQDTIHYKKSWVHFSVTARKKKWVVRFKREESMCPAFWPCFLFIIWILHRIFLVFSFNYLLRKKKKKQRRVLCSCLCHHSWLLLWEYY